MPNKSKPVPEGYNSITPYLIVNDAENAIKFYMKVFGAAVLYRIPGPDGKIGHAELKIGDSHIMLADEFPEIGAMSPKSIGGSPVNLLLYVNNADETVKKALDAGAKQTSEISDKFYGDRTGGIEDPFGHQWTIATHIEDVSIEEIKKRAASSM